MVVHSSKGVIPVEAEIKSASKKKVESDMFEGEVGGAGKSNGGGFESEDEEVDEAALKRGDLEG
jgi:hypothetical protein